MQQEKREQAEQEGNKAQREPAQKKKRRWPLFRLFFLLGLLAACFCWKGYHRKLTSKELDTALTRYMQGKYAIYGDTLTPEGSGKVAYAANDIFYPTTNIYEIKFETKKYPKCSKSEKVVLRYDFKKNTLRDNYMSFVLRKKVEDRFREIFDQIYEPENYELVMAVQSAPWENHEHSAVEKVEEYLKYEVQNSIYLCVIRSVDSKKEDMKKLLELVKKYRYGIKIEIYYMNKEQYKNKLWKIKWISTHDFDFEENGLIIWNKDEDDFSTNLWEKDRNKNVFE